MPISWGLWRKVKLYNIYHMKANKNMHIVFGKLQFSLARAQSIHGRDVVDETERRSNQVIRSLGCQGNGFELHTKTFGVSLKHFKLGRGITRSNLHFLTLTLAEHFWIGKRWLLAFPASPNHSFLPLYGLTELCTQGGLQFLAVWVAACAVFSDQNAVFLSRVLVGTWVAANSRKPK